MIFLKKIGKNFGAECGRGTHQLRRSQMRKMFHVFLWVFTSLMVLTGTVCAEDKKIGVAYFGKSNMTTTVVESFKEEMAKLAPTGIEFEYQLELADVQALGDVVKRFEKEKDAMVILRSNGVEYLRDNPPSIPSFIGGCNHPTELGAVKNLERPEGNITGVSYFVPRNLQFDVFLKLVPDMKSIFLLQEKGHASAPIDIADTEKLAKKLGLKFDYKVCATKEEALEAIAANKKNFQVFIIGSAAMIMDNTNLFVASHPDVIFLSYSTPPVKIGALGGGAADDKKLGKFLAETVVDVMIGGKKISEVPVKFDSEPKFLINAKTAKQFGIEIPYEVLQFATIVGEEK
jgi:putative ABC transport system substrate-binding protein